MKVTFYALLVCLSAGLVVAAPSAEAQTVRGSIRGVVSDSSRAPVPAARVTLTNLDTNRAYTLFSDSQGEFTGVSLPAGAYRVEAEHDGFRTDDSREDFLKIYQAVKYLGWSIHGPVPRTKAPP